MSIRPLRDNIHIKLIVPETDKDIVMPESVKANPTQAEVLKCGPKVDTIKKDDIIIFDSHSPSKVKIGEKEIVIIKEDQVIGILK